MDLKELANIDVVKELGIDKLPQEEQDKILGQMTDVVNQRLILRVLDQMSDEDKDSFNQLTTQSDNEEVIVNFFKEKVPNLDQLAVEEIGRYKGEVLELFGQETEEGKS